MGTSAAIPTYFRVCDGVRIRYADTKSDSATTMLLLAPWPESVFAFRGIWTPLSEAGRVVAIDLPGFGHSDGRPELIAPDAAGAFLAQLIQEWDLGTPHIVGPDVGTAAALFLAARTPALVASLTIGGGAVRVPLEATGALQQTIEAPDLEIIRGLDARTNISAAVESVAPSGTEPEVHEDYVSAYDLGRFAEREREVAVLIYVHELTLGEIGSRLGVSESRVCQIHAELRRRLYEQLNGELSLFAGIG